MATELIIKTTALNYSYAKGINTLSNINLEVPGGSVYGFLGPNGSGKTTTLSLLLGLLKIQKGQISIFGEEMHNEKTSTFRRIGSLIETPSLYGHLTAKENLGIYRQVYDAPMSRIQEVLNIAGLEDTGRKTVKKFSLGMKQRLSIALALLPNPELLILDEPSNGLDPQGIVELRELIKKLNSNGMTILISSHILGEIEKIVTHVGIIVKGEMLFQGALQQLHQFQQKKGKLLINTSDNEKARSLLTEFNPGAANGTLALDLTDLHQVAKINRILINNDLDVYLLQPMKPDLEQLFIDLTSIQS
ncbi:ATP-binding cassette domain-containing protein [Flavitalea sp.]|nr:ATP-binding cassette domain-containing protein [Flavitalea sp.]